MTSTARQGPADARGWLRSIRFSWASFVVIGAIILAVLSLAPKVSLYAKQQQQISALRHQNATEQTQVDALQAEAKRWDDPAYIKAQARQRLLYVMPGETSYLVIDDLPATPAKSTAKVSTEVQQAGGDWAGTLARSLLAPGVEKASAPTAKTSAGK